MADPSCPFCNLDRTRVLVENDFCVAFADGFPLMTGHTLVVPKRHVASLFDLPEVEHTALWTLVAQARARLTTDLHPDGFNVGLNDGQVAGQTVMHAHVHVIPRRTGDCADPRGGIRWIMPEKARYWSDAQ